MSESMSTNEVSRLWGYKQATISNWCENELIPSGNHGKKGSPWRLPKGARRSKLIRKQ